MYDIKTASIERVLENVIDEVNKIVNYKYDPMRIKDRPKKAEKILSKITVTINTFVDLGTRTAQKNPYIASELKLVSDEIREAGTNFHEATFKYLRHPNDLDLSQNLDFSIKGMLSAITRLLILADMIDVYSMTTKLNSIVRRADRMKQMDLNAFMMHEKEFESDIRSMIRLMEKRREDMLDVNKKKSYSIANNALELSNELLHSSLNAFKDHPDLDQAQINRDSAIDNLISAAKQAKNAANELSLNEIEDVNIGEFPKLLEDFENKVLFENCPQNKLKNILREIFFLLNKTFLQCSRDDPMDDVSLQRINQHQEIVKEKLRNLNETTDLPQENRELLMQEFLKATGDLKKTISNYVIKRSYLSFSHLDENVGRFCQVVYSGNVDKIKRVAVEFRNYTSSLSKLVDFILFYSEEVEQCKEVRLLERQITKLTDQFINAGMILILRQDSDTARENFDSYKNNFMKILQLERDSIDLLKNINDFILTAEEQIESDIQDHLGAYQDRDQRLFGLKGQAIQDHCLRLMNFLRVKTQLADQPETILRDIQSRIKKFEDKTLIDFKREHSRLLAFMDHSPDIIKDHENQKNLISLTNGIVESIRTMRKLIIFGEVHNNDPESLDQIDILKTKIQVASNCIEGSGLSTVINQSLAKTASGEKQRHLSNQICDFIQEKNTLNKILAKWNESNNRIITLAKMMSAELNDMLLCTKEVNGHSSRNKVTSPNEIIRMAHNISKYGVELKGECERIGDLSPDSRSKRDLLAYLGRMTLFCHVLTMTCKVKENTQITSDEKQIENMTSLVDASKNLMSAVVQTIKESYILTKYLPKTSDGRSLPKHSSKINNENTLPDCISDSLSNVSDNHGQCVR